MPAKKRDAPSQGNSKSGTTFGGTKVSNPDPPGYRDPGDAPAQGHVDAAGVTSRKSGGRFDAFVSRLVAEGRTKPKGRK